MPGLTFNLSPRLRFIHTVNNKESRRTLVYHSTLKGTLTAIGLDGEVEVTSGTVRILEHVDKDDLGTISYIYSVKPDDFDDSNDNASYDSDSPACYQVDTYIASSTFEHLLNLDESKNYVQVSTEVCPGANGAIRFRGWGYEYYDVEWHIEDKLDGVKYEDITETTIYVTPK